MEVVKYDVTEAAISEMRSIYMDLTVSDIDDKEGFDAVHSARMVVKSKRVAVEKQRKEYKADALEYGRKVDIEAKKIFSLLEPIESHLQTQEDVVINERKRIQAEKEERERAVIQRRVDELQQYGCVMSFFDVASMEVPAFEKKLFEVKDAFEAEQKRLEEERLAREAEEKRMAAERAELEKLRAEQAEREAKIRADQEKIDAEKRAIEEAKRKEQERKDREAFEKQAIENARIAAEKAAKEKAERDAREKAEAEARAKAEAERQAALLPDKEKLLLFSDKIHALSENNLDVKSKAARDLFHGVLASLENINSNFKRLIERL